MNYRKKIALVVIILLSFSCEKKANESPIDDPTGDPVITVETLLTGYEIIWGMDFLPNGDLIFGEKRGKLYRKSGETVTEITGFPAVLTNGQGGLLDIKAHPDYNSNGWIYASYSASNPSGGGMLKLVRFKITNNQVQNLETLFSTNSPNTWYGHYGSRIVFDSNNFLYLSAGEGGTTSYGGQNTSNNNAQTLTSLWGKVHRIHDDGRIPADNPVIAGMKGPSSVFTYGHRNPQGLTIHPVTGEIWATEHGPKGGDEINIITKASNYGWPVYSIGTNYDGNIISSGHTAPGIKEPVYTWTPSIGICGMTFINNSKFKSWNGSLVVCGLASQKLYRCTISGGKVISEEVILSDFGRVRNVVQGTDGSLYVSVENPGRIIRISPE